MDACPLILIHKVVRFVRLPKGQILARGEGRGTQKIWPASNLRRRER